MLLLSSSSLLVDMRSLALSMMVLSVFAASVLSFSIPFSSFGNSAPGTGLTRRACDNSASDRSCWGDYDISTDYYNEVYSVAYIPLQIILNTVGRSLIQVSLELIILSSLTPRRLRMALKELSSLSMVPSQVHLSKRTGATPLWFT